MNILYSTSKVNPNFKYQLLNQMFPSKQSINIEYLCCSFFSVIVNQKKSLDINN